MRVLSIAVDGRRTWGILDEDRSHVRCASDLFGAPIGVLDLLQGNASRWLDELRRSGDVRSVDIRKTRVLAPVPEPPGDVIALGLNYRPHVAETEFRQPSRPIVFSKAATSVIGPDEPVHFSRRVTTQVDWEVELAVVIGVGGRDIKRDDALNHIFGFTIANDISARDLQFADGGQWYQGKSLDSFCPLGPWIVTRDELPDLKGLKVMLRVNGVTKQSATIDDLIFDIPKIIEAVSLGRTLRSGDVILTGTPGGVGFTRKPPEFLHDGDRVEAEIESIGVLGNLVEETE